MNDKTTNVFVKACIIEAGNTELLFLVTYINSPSVTRLDRNKNSNPIIASYIFSYTNNNNTKWKNALVIDNNKAL